MKLKDLLEGKDLKGIAVQVGVDINGGIIDDTIEHVVDGNQGGDKVYPHIVDTIDTTKKNYGKRGTNLIAYVGIIVITTEYDVDSSQAVSIFKKLDTATQTKFNNLIKNELKRLETQLAE